MSISASIFFGYIAFSNILGQNMRPRAEKMGLDPEKLRELLAQQLEEQGQAPAQPEASSTQGGDASTTEAEPFHFELKPEELEAHLDRTAACEQRPTLARLLSQCLAAVLPHASLPDLERLAFSQCVLLPTPRTLCALAVLLVHAVTKTRACAIRPPRWVAVPPGPSRASRRANRTFCASRVCSHHVHVVWMSGCRGS